MHGENEVLREQRAESTEHSVPYPSYALLFALCAMLFIAATVWAKQVDAASLRLTWTDTSDDEGGFRIERLVGSTYVEIATVGSNVESYVDQGLLGGTTHCYRVRAFNSEGDSDYSNEACAATATTLTVTKTGAGDGTVSSSPAGINCGTNCSGGYISGTIVTLAATPVAGSVLTGWSGGVCAGTGTCMLTVDADTDVTATFDLQPSEVLPPGQATLIAPSGAITTGTPTYTWHAGRGATWYLVFVASRDRPWIWRWYTAADVGCVTDTSICSITPSTSLPFGQAFWGIYTWNDAGYGPWSNPMWFTVTGAP